MVSLIKIKATLAKEFHIQPSEIERMPYWEYEMWIQEIQNQVKEQNDYQEKEMKKYDIGKMEKNMKKFQNPQKMVSQGTPKMPSFGNVTLNMPK